MVRSKKIVARERSAEDATAKLLKIIVADIVQTASMPFKDWSALSPSPLVPLAISVSPSHQYRVTQAAIDAAHKLTQETWVDREELRQTIEREAFNKLAFSAIGEAIQEGAAQLRGAAEVAQTSLDDDTFYGALAARYTSNLDRLAGQARPDIDRHIPCHLFHAEQGVHAFAIGPVQFRPRADWIDRFVTDLAERDYIRQADAGTLPMATLSQQAFAPNRPPALHNAWSVLNALRGFAWVATTRMIGHEPTQSHEKASLIAGLAIDALGLRFQAEDARRFTKAGRQHLFAEDRLATSINGSFLRGSRIQMPGIGSKPGALAAKMTSELPFLDAAGRILGAYVNARQTGRAPHLVERWVNALYWVGEARREASDFMAVVDYGCAADGLSGAGGNATVMTDFAEAALNPTGQLASPGATSVSDAVTTVYREGRNKLAHGEMSGLLEDLAEARAIGDALLVNLFDAVTAELASVITDRPEIFEIDEKHAYRAFKERLRMRS